MASGLCNRQERHTHGINRDETRDESRAAI